MSCNGFRCATAWCSTWTTTTKSSSRVPCCSLCPQQIAFPPRQSLINPLQISVYERPLLNLAGAVCTQAWSGDDGGLHLGFSRGHRIDVDPDEQFTAWELYGKRHGYMACLPHGRVRVVRHDIPESDDANIVNR